MALDKYKRVSTHGTPNDPRGEDAAEKYIPYETSGHPQERMHIIRHDDTMHYPSYRYLMDIIHNKDGDGVVLVYSFLMVKITGQNLDKLIDDIAHGNITFIRKFNPRKWARPGDGMPIIESIDVVARSDSEGLSLDKDKKSRPTPERNEYH